MKSKEVKVAILQEKVRIELDGKSVLDEKLFERVEPSQCIWNLEDKKKVVLSLDKVLINIRDKIFSRLHLHLFPLQ